MRLKGFRGWLTGFALGIAAAVLSLVPSAAWEHEASDPVCGMQVDSDTARFSIDHAGQRYFFCSDGCRKAFRDSPGQYVSLSKLSAQVEGR